MTGIDVLDAFLESAVAAGEFLQSFVGGHAGIDGVHHLAEVNEFVTYDGVVLVEGYAGDISFSHFQISHALFLGRVHGAHLRAEPLAEEADNEEN